MQNSSSEMLHPTDDTSEYNNENDVADILDSMPPSDSNTLISRLRAEIQALRAQNCHLSDEVKSLQAYNQSLLIELEPIRALKAGKAWLVQQGFMEGDAHSKIQIDGRLMSPLQFACEQRNLDACRWLYANGASADITRANNDGITPMYAACGNGHMSAVCQWLILNGALNDEEDHVNEDIIICDVRTHPQSAAALQTWSQEMISIHSTFLNAVLRGSVLVPLSQQHVPPQQRCRLPMLNRGVLEVVGSYLGLVIGRQIRNVQEVRAVLSSVLDQE